MTIKQTAGRDQLGEFAPDFAHFNDDVLFGENWNSSDIDLKTRCIITVVALMSSGSLTVLLFIIYKMLRTMVSVKLRLLLLSHM